MVFGSLFAFQKLGCFGLLFLCMIFLRRAIGLGLEEIGRRLYVLPFFGRHVHRGVHVEVLRSHVVGMTCSLEGMEKKGSISWKERRFGLVDGLYTP